MGETILPFDGSIFPCVQAPKIPWQTRREIKKMFKYGHAIIDRRIDAFFAEKPELADMPDPEYALSAFGNMFKNSSLSLNGFLSLGQNLR